MKIYLARHGQTTGDVEGRFGGSYDDHLTEKGQRQSAQLADRLAEIERASGQFDRVFSSQLGRAQETARFITQKIGLAALALPEFNERNAYGILTGMTRDEAEDRHPDQVRLLKDYRETVEGGEPYDDFRSRVSKGLCELSLKHFEKVVVVTHGGPIRVVFREILKLGEAGVGDCAYASIDAKLDRDSQIVDYRLGEEISGIVIGGRSG